MKWKFPLSEVTGFPGPSYTPRSHGGGGWNYSGFFTANSLCAPTPPSRLPSVRRTESGWILKVYTLVSPHLTSCPFLRLGLHLHSSLSHDCPSSASPKFSLLFFFLIKKNEVSLGTLVACEHNQKVFIRCHLYAQFLTKNAKLDIENPRGPWALIQSLRL